MTEEREQDREESPGPDRGDGIDHAALTVQEGEAGVSAEGATEAGELRAELDALNDRHLRLAAEFDNYRKRNERERRALAARLQVDLVASLLDVLDDLERVAQNSDATAEAVIEGIRLVDKKFRTVLAAAGLEPLDVEGEPFDPATMEALLTVPTADPERDDEVADVLQRGYRFRDVLVRPARVSVRKHDPADDAE